MKAEEQIFAYKELRNNGQAFFIDTYEDADRIIEALEKQIPQIPNYSGDGYYNGEIVIDTWECPCCGKQYEIDHDDYKYCPNCGQHIDHSTLTEDD